jgi:hypothetical protein
LISLPTALVSALSIKTVTRWSGGMALIFEDIGSKSSCSGTMRLGYGRQRKARKGNKYVDGNIGNCYN